MQTQRSVLRTYIGLLSVMFLLSGLYLMSVYIYIYIYMYIHRAAELRTRHRARCLEAGDLAGSGFTL